MNKKDNQNHENSPTQIIASLLNDDFEQIKTTQLYKTSDDYLIREIAGEYILVPVGKGAQQMNGMLELNETFQRLLTLFQAPHTIDEVVQLIKEEYEDINETIENDICQFVEECLYFNILKEEPRK